MLALENAEEVLQILDRYTKQKSKDIPPELDEYLNYVAKTGDTVYRWPTIQYLFREKLINVIKEFHDTTASIEDLPQCPNVDQFNYESMKSALIEKLERFQAAPFTVQRLCELLTDPKKHYSRLDKFMRALEKNILVVSTVEPGRKPTTDGEENGDEPMNGVTLSEEKNAENAVVVAETGAENAIAADAPNLDQNVSKRSKTFQNDSYNSEESATDAIPSTAIESNNEESVEPETKNESSIEIDETASAEPVAVEAKATDATTEEAVKCDASASEEPIVAATAAAIENKTDDEKVVVDEAKPEEIAQIIESLDLPPAAVEKIDKPLTPKHAREEDDLDDELEEGVRTAKKMRLNLNDEINAAIASLPAADDVSAESKAIDEKIDIESASEPTPVEPTPTKDSVEESAAAETAPIELNPIESEESKAIDEKIDIESASEPTPIEPTPTKDSVEEAIAVEPTPIESTPATDLAAEQPTEAVTEKLIENSQEIEPKPVAVAVEPSAITEIDSSVVTGSVEEALAAEVTPSVDIPVPELLAENLTALIPTNLLPAVNESDMAPTVDAPEPIVNQESMTVEETETAVGTVDPAEENAEKMDAAPITDDQMDVDDADAPMDL